MTLAKSAGQGGFGNLKESLALLFLTNLGAECTPSDWLDGHLDSMCVEFESTPGSLEVASSDLYAQVQEATTLRVKMISTTAA